MQNYGEIWNAILAEMKKEFSETSVNLWFSEIELAAITDKVAVLVVPSNFKHKILEEKFPGVIRRYLAVVLGYETDAVILSSEDGYPDLTPYIGAAAPAQRNGFMKQEETAKPEIPETDPIDENQKRFISGDARKRYTFDNFLVGSSNKYAHGAAIAVAKDPATAYNPLFIYGASGLGKTHLLYAITNQMLENDPDAKIMYVTGEDFTNQMIRSIGNHSTDAFRERFRNCSALLIDDIQFIAGKVGTQEEFFHTFNVLYEEGKQIILTSDRPPKDINPLEDRLRNRFEWGLIADIQPPNLELRIAIMKDKAKKMNIDIPDEVFVYLAENLKNNVRQLEGALKKIAAKSYLENARITFDLAKESISDMISGTPPVNVTIDRILTVVSQKYGVPIVDIKSKKKSAHIVGPRHICVYLIRRMTDMSLGRIGKLFGKDHTTIMNSIKNVENEINNNSGYESEINDLIQEISEISTEKKQ